MSQRLENYGLYCAVAIGILAIVVRSCGLGITIFVLLGLLVLLRSGKNGPPAARA